MIQITGIGANVMDTLFRLDQYPDEDTKQPAMEVTRCGGGPCGTALVTASKLGASCSYIGNCSDDPAGSFLRTDFETYGVRTSHMRTVSDTTGFQSTILLSDKTSTRTCVFHRGNVPPTKLDAADHTLIRNSQVLLVDGNDLDAAVEGAKIARSAGTLVLYDAGGRYPGVEQLLPLADILIPSEEFALKQTGETSVQTAAKILWLQYQPKVVVITQGKNGGIFYDGVQLRSYPAFPVDAVDTNGSGDVFHGAFAFGLTRGWDYDRCCVFSSAVSALKCTKLGARAGVPSFEATLVFLKNRNAEF